MIKDDDAYGCVEQVTSQKLEHPHWRGASSLPAHYASALGYKESFLVHCTVSPCANFL